MAGPQKKYMDLFQDNDVKRWYNELSRNSRITADTYLRRLGSVCGSIHLTPLQIIETEEKALTDLISDYITECESKGFAGSYISSTIKAVKSWMTYNNRKFSRKIKISRLNDTPSLKGERIPTQEELKRILASGDPRSRAACILMAHSGTRPEVLGNYLGNDGLRIADLPDMRIKDGVVSFERIPAMVTVRADLSKARRQYFTFIGQEGCFYIKAYVEERIQEGEKVAGDSPLIVPSKLALRSMKKCIRTINIGDIVRMPIRKAGFQWRPYVLRSFFDTQLMMAESKGRMLRDYRQFFMGHVGDIEHRYTVNKHVLPESVIEEMRASYSKALKFLETEQKGIPEEDFTKQLRESMIRMFEATFGSQFSEQEREDLFALGIDDFYNRLGEYAKEKRADILNNGNKHKTIPERDLESYLNKGWELVQIYPKGDKAVVKLP